MGNTGVLQAVGSKPWKQGAVGAGRRGSRASWEQGVVGARRRGSSGSKAPWGARPSREIGLKAQPCRRWRGSTCSLRNRRAVSIRAAASHRARPRIPQRGHAPKAPRPMHHCCATTPTKTPGTQLHRVMYRAEQSRHKWEQSSVRELALCATRLLPYGQLDAHIPKRAPTSRSTTPRHATSRRASAQRGGAKRFTQSSRPSVARAPRSNRNEPFRAARGAIDRGWQTTVRIRRAQATGAAPSSPQGAAIAPGCPVRDVLRSVLSGTASATFPGAAGEGLDLPGPRRAVRFA